LPHFIEYITLFNTFKYYFKQHLSAQHVYPHKPSSPGQLRCDVPRSIHNNPLTLLWQRSNRKPIRLGWLHCWRRHHPNHCRRQLPRQLWPSSKPDCISPLIQSQHLQHMAPNNTTAVNLEFHSISTNTSRPDHPRPRRQRLPDLVRHGPRWSNRASLRKLRPLLDNLRRLRRPRQHQHRGREHGEHGVHDVYEPCLRSCHHHGRRVEARGGDGR